MNPRGNPQFGGIPQPTTQGRQNPWDTAHRFDLIGPLEIKEDGRFYRPGTTSQVPVPGSSILQSLIFREGGAKTGVSFYIEEPDGTRTLWVDVGVLTISRPVLSEVPGPAFPGNPVGITDPSYVIIVADDDPSGLAYFKLIRWAGIQRGTLDVPFPVSSEGGTSGDNQATGSIE